MKKRIISWAVVCSSMSIQVNAQAITANDLAKWCSSPLEAEERAACILTVSAFMNGFVEGVGHGIFGVYAHDSLVHASVESLPVKQVATRAQQVNERILCIQKVSVEALADAFIKRMEDEEPLRARNYREGLYRTIASFCK